MMYKRDKYVLTRIRNLSIHYYYYYSRFNKTVLVMWFSQQVMYINKSKTIKINLTSNHQNVWFYVFFRALSEQYESIHIALEH